MPIISVFYGIIVAIYYEDTGRHNKPHIHVRYQGKKASISIEEEPYLLEISPQNNYGWFWHGLTFTKMNFWLTGS